MLIAIALLIQMHSRRKFLGTTAVTLGAAMATNQVFAQDAIATNTMKTFGTELANAPRVLVAYASANGSTGGVAEAIGAELAAHGDVHVDVRLMAKVEDIAQYHGVVLGSAIHSSKWLPEAEAFLKANREALQAIPCAFFLVCMTMANPTAKNLG